MCKASAGASRLVEIGAQIRIRSFAGREGELERRHCAEWLRAW